MEVMVVRHGIAMDREVALDRAIGDRDRPLTDKGRSRMKRIAKGLSRRAPGISSILTSPLKRAIETAEILADDYGDLTCTMTPALLPEADPDELARALAEHAAEPLVAVVGHEPHLSGFISWCLTGRTAPVVEVKKGGACLVRFDGAPEQTGGRLIWLAPPAILRHI